MSSTVLTPKRNASRTQGRILAAATAEFAAKGLDGARVDEIARRSGVNKNMLYHYFGSKEDLFVATLETVYGNLRRRHGDISIRGLEPVEGMRKLISSTFEAFVEMPEIISLMNTENLHRARHIRRSEKIRQMYNPLLETISELLRRGQASGSFRNGIDPIDLYISISALGYHYLSNQHTFSEIFGTDLTAKERLRQRHDHIIDVILSYCAVRPD